MTSEAATAQERGGRESWSNRRAPNAWRRLIRKVSLAWGMFLFQVFCFLISHPLVFKIGFAVLRRSRPIAVIGSQVLVAKANDVGDVLARLDDFTVTEFLGPKMPWGQFLLNLDWREQHRRERQILESVVNRTRDGEQIKILIANTVKNATKQGGRNEINIVKDLCEPAVLKIAVDYFGIPENWDADEMMRIMRHLGGIVMIEPPEGSRRWNEARDCIEDFTKQLKDAVARKTLEAGNAPLQTDDLLSRFANGLAADAFRASGVDQDFVRRYVTGLATAGTATIVRAATHAIDRLLAHPAGLKEAQRLAAKLTICSDPAEADALRCQLLQVVYEALRFRPTLPLLVRHCPRDTILGKGEKHARMVTGGAQVIAAPIAAMFDPKQFERPWRFQLRRPLERYVHFGVGPRLCFGKYVVDIALIEIIREVVLLAGVRRAPGSRGRVSYDGPVPTSLVVTFDPAQGAPRQKASRP